MAVIRRIYVEKKAGYDIEAKAMLLDLRENLAVAGLRGLRLLNRYDVSGISAQEMKRARQAVFAEPPVDEIYDECFPLAVDETAFASEFLPGQYDQRADSAAQCLQLLSPGSESPKGTSRQRAGQPLVVTARVVVLRGNLGAEELERIKRYFINPVDCREAALSKPTSLAFRAPAPAAVPVLKKFASKSAAALAALGNELGLAMDAADLRHCQAYFRDTEQRDPTLTEIRLLDTYWSDHCRHTTFLTALSRVAIDPDPSCEPVRAAYGLYGERPGAICLMDLALLAMRELRAAGRLNDVEFSEEINACSMAVTVDIDGKKEEWLVMFKNETHNHPTEIEPFGGAATCLGGAIRDPLSGRAYVYQAMRVTGSGDPRAVVADTLPGKLPQRKITTEAAHGFSSYGNQVGLATGQVSEVYHPGYVAKRLEIGAVIGAAPRKNVRRRVPRPGDKVLLVGGRTGRDGIGGATGSSKAHGESSLASCGAEVQKGNPPGERKLQRLFRDPVASRMIKRCNDFGAGGVAVAVGELAPGLDVDLDRVPKKYAGLDGGELALSESQERMAVVVAGADASRFQRLAAAENLEATVIATVVARRRLRMAWRGRTIVDLDRDFLDSHGAERQASVEVAAPDVGKDFFKTAPALARLPDLAMSWTEVLSSLNVCSQKGLVERFDSSIGAATVFSPFGGKYQATPADVMIAKIPLLCGETHSGTVMGFGFNPQLSSWSPFHGGLYAVIEAVARVTACGGDFRCVRLSLQEYFPKPGRDPRRWGLPFAALLGAFIAQQQLEIPAIGGKDSMSGTFGRLDVPPTLVAFAVTGVDVRRVVSPEFKKAGSQVLWLPLPRDNREMPDFVALKKNYARVHNLINKGKLLAAQSLHGGGLAEGLSKMCFGNRLGMAFDAPQIVAELFTPAIGSLVLEVPEKENVSELFSGLDCRVLGKTLPEAVIKVNGLELDLASLREHWEKPLEDVFPTRVEKKPLVADPGWERPLAHERACSRGRGHRPLVRPRVLLTVFPGTNNEYDVSRAFARAGGKPETFVFRNQRAVDIEASSRELAATIKRSQILMLPGGFSAGDEPDGSGKFIAAVFRHPSLRDAIHELIDKKDGLILGICNGFQALVKLGLLPHGEIRELTADSPTLTFNLIGRLVSRPVRTKLVSTLSPWFGLCRAGDIHTLPVAHAEGRFVAPAATVELLFSLGQVATQYVDFEGKPTLDSFFNPNGSMLAIEAISSPDGRILGKMAHSDRISPHVLQNIPGDKDQKLFASGVKYFQ
ncbi:MAG: phosphoribosylformylglycinamidine synthase [Candidatus Aminicenantes bacterium]|nr:phosphoribosylformylglycinamidine synthase [Candidatus Aminicenantes bacterium]